MVLVKYTKIKNRKINKTSSKVSIWMLYASVMSIICASIKLWTEDAENKDGAKHQINITFSTIQALFDTSNTLIQSYEWYTMNEIIQEQKGECMEWIMKNMQDVQYKDEFKYKEWKHRIVFYVIILINSLIWVAYGLIDVSKYPLALNIELLVYNII